MSSASRSLSLAAICFLLCLPVITNAQKKQIQEPEQKPRKIKSEPDTVFKEWPNRDVGPIITPEERQAYDRLKTNEERENFILEFWRRRDPTPDTEENEYKDEYYERLAYANEHFASGKPGSMTDRGRIYLKFGKPDEIESHPAGGPYERASYEGGGSTTVYPFERWFYRNINLHSGIGPTSRSGVEIEFVDPTGSGEYRIAHNFNEKDALIFVPGAGPTLGEMWFGESRADRIAGTNGFGSGNYRREPDSPFAMMDLIRDLESAPAVNSPVEGRIGTTGGPKTEDNPLSFDVAVYCFRQSSSLGIAAFTIQTDNKELSFNDSGGLQTAKLNIHATITSVAEHRVGAFEDVVTTTATVAELADAKERKSIYGKAVSLKPGVYRVDVIVRDIATGATGVRHYSFTIPKSEAEKLGTSTIVLASKLENVGEQPAMGQFIIGQTKVIPNLSGIFHRGAPVGVYLQVYNAGIDQTTLRPAVDVEYQLSRNGKDLGRQQEDWRDMGNASERLILARLIDSRGLVPGDYELQIRIRDRVTGQTLSPSAKFTIAP